MIQLSAVIPFRNRDPLRLRAAIQSIASSTTVPHEIVVSDYGSDDPTIAEDVAKEFDARVVYTQAGHWSRSASLNAGFAAAGGKVLLGADADIIWGPGAIDQTAQRILADDRHAVAFECQFMGPEITVEMVQKRDHDWALYDRHSKLNPRWGVGMLFFPRFAFELANGYEARMKTYGYEDNDFSNRIRAVGYPIHWVGARDLRAYHVWHERPGILAKTDPELAKEYDANRVLFLNDKSVVRNVVQGGFGAGPLVTVAIATRGRPELLETALASVLCQTVQDFEVVVVEDGPVDDRTRLVVESFGDERLKYVPQDWAGISAARNRALDMSTGRFTAVMDDDDIMPPWRLEASLGAIRAGEHGCVGSFVTFSDLSGELVSWQDPFPTLLGASMRGGFAGHPTWLVRTDVLRAFRYDESFSSAVDNNLALRMVRSGIKLRHSGEVLNVRRVHEGQVTALDSAFQGRGAKLNSRWLSAGLTSHEIQENVKSGRESQMARKPSQADHDAVVALLPDALVTRRTVLIATQEAEARKWRERAGVREIVEANFDGVFFAQITVDGLTWRELADVQRTPNLHITKWDSTSASVPVQSIVEYSTARAVRAIEETVSSVAVTGLGREATLVEGRGYGNASFYFSRTLGADGNVHLDVVMERVVE